MSAFIDKSAWEVLKEIDREQANFFFNLLDSFLHTTPKALEKLEKAKQAKNFKEIYYYAHNLKSSCRTLGAMDLAKQFEKIENSSKRIIDEAVDDRWQEIKEIVEQVLIQIKEERDCLRKAA